MDHSLARSIFEEIQARPYRIAVEPDQKVNNCYYKTIELIQRIGALGYPVRARIGESYWDKNLIPAEVVDLQPTDPCMTHIYPEVMVDGQWRIVDPTMQPALAKIGFTIGSWDGTETSCFPITKLFDLEEAVAFWEKWSDRELGMQYMLTNRDAFRVLDQWFEKMGNDNADN